MELNNIEILKAAFHQLNLGGNNVISNSSILNFSGMDDSEFADTFFKKHIKQNRIDSKTKQSYFINSRTNPVRRICQELFKNYNMLLEELIPDDQFNDIFLSKTIEVTNLFRLSMEGKSSSDGTIFSFLYKENENLFLGILKMDPDSGIKIDNDEENLKLEIVPSLLPGEKEKLHKCAFIKIDSLIDDIDTQEDASDAIDLELFVLDKQTSKGGKTQYFFNEFLQVKEIARNDNLTDQFLKHIPRGVREYIHLGQLPAFNKNLIIELSKNEPFDLDINLVKILKPYLKDSYKDIEMDNIIQPIKEQILKDYPDAVFTINGDFSNDSKIEYKDVDKKIKISIDKDKLVDVKFDQDTTYYILKIDKDEFDISVWPTK